MESQLSEHPGSEEPSPPPPPLSLAATTTPPRSSAAASSTVSTAAASSAASSGSMPGGRKLTHSKKKRAGLFEVRGIVGMKELDASERMRVYSAGRLPEPLFHVQWRGYSDADTTWQTASSFAGGLQTELIQKYLRQQLSKQSKHDLPILLHNQLDAARKAHDHTEILRISNHIRSLGFPDDVLPIPKLVKKLAEAAAAAAGPGPAAHSNPHLEPAQPLLMAQASPEALAVAAAAAAAVARRWVCPAGWRDLPGDRATLVKRVTPTPPVAAGVALRSADELPLHSFAVQLAMGTRSNFNSWQALPTVYISDEGALLKEMQAYAKRTLLSDWPHAMTSDGEKSALNDKIFKLSQGVLPLPEALKLFADWLHATAPLPPGALLPDGASHLILSCAAWNKVMDRHQLVAEQHQRLEWCKNHHACVRWLSVRQCA